jgi:HD-GYP domain-containing protein (c-di-GMP phosphodiesterase class II)
MLIAGYLHDLGKIAVPSEILEKPSKLDIEEFNVMRSHTYYTYRVLNKIKALQTITEWAAFHHERLDGTGYPFRLKGNELSLGARIMAVADVFTASSEDRPYRSGMEKEKVINILKSMAKNNALCPNVTDVILRNFDAINSSRIVAQEKSQKDYENVQS